MHTTEGVEAMLAKLEEAVALAKAELEERRRAESHLAPRATHLVRQCLATLKEPITVRELHGHLRGKWGPYPRELSAVLAWLEDHGEIEIQRQQMADGGPVVRWVRLL